MLVGPDAIAPVMSVVSAAADVIAEPFQGVEDVPDGERQARVKQPAASVVNHPNVVSRPRAARRIADAAE